MIYTVVLHIKWWRQEGFHSSVKLPVNSAPGLQSLFDLGDGQDVRADLFGDGG